MNFSLTISDKIAVAALLVGLLALGVSILSLRSAVSTTAEYNEYIAAAELFEIDTRLTNLVIDYIEAIDSIPSSKGEAQELHISKLESIILQFDVLFLAAHNFSQSSKTVKDEWTRVENRVCQLLRNQINYFSNSYSEQSAREAKRVCGDAT